MRIRTIKPEFWMHEGLCKCPEFTRLLAIALLNWADDEGYFMANPVLIRGQVFPFMDESKMIPRSLQDLSRVGWIELGTDEQGRDVGRIINFAKHQRVDKPKPSSIKENFTFQDDSKNDPRNVQEASKEEGKGKEEEGKGKERPQAVHSFPTVDEVKEFIQTIPGVPLSEAVAIHGKWEANGFTVNGKKMKDWKLTIRNWNNRGFLDYQKAGYRPLVTSQTGVIIKHFKDREQYEEWTDENGVNWMKVGEQALKKV